MSRSSPSFNQHPKGISTFNEATGTPPPLSRPVSESRKTSPTLLASGPDNRNTTAFVRRVLCAHAHISSADSDPIGDILPPLTSSNETDLQLYAVIAIIIKEVVYSWYGKVTTDQGLVEETVRIVAHCTRALESRLREVDLESLIFDEIAELITNHITGWKVTQWNLSQGRQG